MRKESRTMLAAALIAALAAGSVQAGEPKPKAKKLDTWDWVKHMREVTKGFTGTQGVTLHLGDSLTYANQATRWAWFYGFNSTKGGYTQSDREILDWTHAKKKDNKLNGWWQAKVDKPHGRSCTAASGIRTDQYLKGGYHGLPALKDILKEFNPQIAVILLGTNDAHAGRPVEKVAANMGKIIDTVLANHTIPVLMTLPPSTKFHDRIKQYNAAYVKLAREKKIPLIDLYGEIMARAPTTWQKDIINPRDGIHFTYKLANGPATDENLAKCGYLLRCWVVVQKLKEIKRKVIDRKS